jgi:hypothetical protein
MPRIQDIKILDLEETTYFDRDDSKKEKPLPGVNVTFKFPGEKRSEVATLKKEHLELGIHRQLDDMRGLGKFVTMNLGAMGNGNQVTWFFPGESRGGVKPVLQTVEKPVLVSTSTPKTA